MTTPLDHYSPRLLLLLLLQWSSDSIVDDDSSTLQTQHRSQQNHSHATQRPDNIAIR
jgi:hypothetical protein